MGARSISAFRYSFPLFALLLSGRFSVAPVAAESITQSLSPTNSSITFGVTSPSPTLQMNGKFSKFKGTWRLDPTSIKNSHIALSLDLQSAQLPPDQILQAVFLQTALSHLRSPLASFESTSFQSQGGDHYLVSGVYTWQGKPHSVEVPVQVAKLSPASSEVRLTLSGRGSDCGNSPQIQAVTGASLDQSKGWAKAILNFRR